MPAISECGQWSSKKAIDHTTKTNWPLNLKSDPGRPHVLKYNIVFITWFSFLCTLHSLSLMSSPLHNSGCRPPTSLSSSPFPTSRGQDSISLACNIIVSFYLSLCLPLAKSFSHFPRKSHAASVLRPAVQMPHLSHCNLGLWAVTKPDSE